MAEFDKAKYKAIEREAYSRKARSYEKYGSAIFENLASPLLEMSQIRPGEKVLDVACGVGIPSLAAAKLIAPGGSLVGVDLAPGMVDLARIRAQRLGLSNISFQEADAEQLPFPNESFDAVLCHQGLVHFTDRTKALGEMRRVLKPGGRVALSVWSTPDQTVVIGMVAKTIAELWPDAILPGAPTWFDFGASGAIETIMREVDFRELDSKRVDHPLEVQDGEEYWQTNLGISGRLEMLLNSVPTEISQKIASKAKSEAEKWREGTILRIPCEEIICRAIK
jgi:ubiquinone/menaquinone biosynthesis C-methylase UbiE